ncbi:MAG: two-component system response regulator, partial [Spirochaetales bacterium]|nr:two-component system response regulator [Spirochaetales bacterium]
GRITAICDVFDALLSERPYKGALPLEDVKEILESGKGTHFDPVLLALFMDHVDEMKEIFDKYE